jgi:hypothetical protein
MGISTEITSDSWGVGSKAWLLHRKGMDTCRPITLDLTLFTAAGADYVDFIPSGTSLGIVTVGGLYAPYDNTETNGTEDFVGYLFEDVRLNDSEGNAFSVAAGALFWEGIVRRDNLPAAPTGPGDHDTAAESDVTTIRYER